MKAVSAEEAVAMIPNGASIMVGGFMGVGTPERLLDELVRQRKTGLFLISNDAAVPGKGVGKLFDTEQISRMIGTHIGLNPNAQRQMLGNQITVDLIPQGTFVERIRAGGCGLGGVLTPTGSAPSLSRASKRSRSTASPICWKPPCTPTLLGARFPCRLCGQSLLCADRAQFQSGDGHGRGDGDRHGRQYRADRRHSA